MKQPIRKKVAEANNIDTRKYKYTCIFDMNNIMKIASVSHKKNQDGKDYGMVVNAIGIIGNVLRKKDFDYCIGAYDGDGSGYLRWRIYGDYKANRGKNYAQHGLTDYDKRMLEYQRLVLSKSRGSKGEESEEESFDRQKRILQSILQELCIRQYEYDNVEGDDIISNCVKLRKADEKIVIVSSDKDLTQLISDSVIVYNPRTKEYVTKENAAEKIGVLTENVVVEKIICGDASDNIKGVKLVGNDTLLKLFPQLKSEKVDLETIKRLSREMLEERKASKKKPLKSLENILNGVTDGIQGDRLYEINEKIIDLSEPMLTDEARKAMDDELYAPIDVTEMSMKNVYEIVTENKMEEVMDEGRFGALFEPFSRIAMMETRRYEEYRRGVS